MIVFYFATVGPSVDPICQVYLLLVIGDVRDKCILFTAAAFLQFADIVGTKMVVENQKLHLLGLF